jgi:hypothetical protein
MSLAREDYISLLILCIIQLTKTIVSVLSFILVILNIVVITALFHSAKMKMQRLHRSKLENVAVFFFVELLVCNKSELV